MQSPEELARQKIDALLQQCGWIGDQTPKDWSSSDKTSAKGEARRVSACSANQFQQFVTPDDGRKFTELYNGAIGDGATWTLDPQGSLNTRASSVPPAVKPAPASANLDDFVNCYFGGKHAHRAVATVETATSEKNPSVSRASPTTN